MKTNDADMLIVYLLIVFVVNCIFVGGKNEYYLEI